MNAGALFLLALFVPLLLAAVLLLPPYLGMFGATYLVYAPVEGVSPIADKLLNVFYIIDAYERLLSHWLSHMGSVGFIDYTLPVVGLPLLCTIGSLWLTRFLSRKFLDVFYSFSATGR